jgi:hypothetical protein
MIKSPREIMAELAAWADRYETATPDERKQMEAEVHRESKEHRARLKAINARGRKLKRLKTLDKKIVSGEASFEEQTEHKEIWNELFANDNDMEDREKEQGTKH